VVLNLFKNCFVFIHQKHSWPMGKANNKTTGPQCVKLQVRRIV